MDKEAKELAKIRAQIKSALLDVTVTDVRKISRSDALEIARASGKDWQKLKDFQQRDSNGKVTGHKSLQNGGSVDLIEIFYASDDPSVFGSVITDYSYNRSLSDFHDFNVGDRISIFYGKEKPAFVYSQANGCLSVCFDVKHLNLHPNTGVTLKLRDEKTTMLVVRSIYHLREQGLLLDPGATPRMTGSPVRYRFKPKDLLPGFLLLAAVLGAAYYFNLNKFLFGFILLLALAFVGKLLIGQGKTKVPV